jgi:hypothetical protein
MEEEVSIQKQVKPFRVQLDELRERLRYLDSLPDKGWDEP